VRARDATWATPLKLTALAAVLAGFAVLAFVPVQGLPSLHPWDLALHAAAFALLTALAYAIRPRPVLAGVAAFALSAVIEGLQGLAPERTPSLLDLAANAIGVALAVACILALRRRANRQA
jgi:VanZ family protein